MGFFSTRNLTLLECAFGLASTPSQRLDALQLRQRVYAAKGLVTAEEMARPYVPPQSFVPRSGLLVATRRDVVVGSLSVYADSGLGLPMEEAHPREVEAMRRRVTSLVELGGLAVADEVRSEGVTLMLFRTAFRWALAQGATGIVICVHPSSARIYRSLLHFEVLGAVTAHPRFRRALSVPLGLDVALAVKSRPHAEGRGKIDLFSLFCDDDTAPLPSSLPEPSGSGWTLDEIARFASGASADSVRLQADAR